MRQIKNPQDRAFAWTARSVASDVSNPRLNELLRQRDLLNQEIRKERKRLRVKASAKKERVWLVAENGLVLEVSQQGEVLCRRLPEGDEKWTMRQRSLTNKTAS